MIRYKLEILEEYPNSSVEEFGNLIESKSRADDLVTKKACRVVIRDMYRYAIPIYVAYSEEAKALILEAVKKWRLTPFIK